MPRKITKISNKTRKTPGKLVKRERKSPPTVGALGQALRALGGIGGGIAGGYIGNPAVGASIGTNLGAALSQWLGSGDYEVSKNSIVAKASTGIPMMHKSGQSITVRHKEFIATISGSTGFVVQKTFVLNPGIPQTFPWLSKLASQFSEYEVKGMVFHYVPTSGTFNGSTAALGSVMMQTTYRATDTAPTTKVELLNEYWAGETVPYDTLVHPIECDPKENPFAVHYVRTADVPDSEPLLYDIGKTFIATQGMADTGIVGDLWVTYEIELKKPIISSSATPSVNPAYCSVGFSSPVRTDMFSGLPPYYYHGVTTLTFGAANVINVPARNSHWVVTMRVDADTSFALTGTSGWQNPVVLGGSSLSLYPFDSTANIACQIISATTGTAAALWYQFGIVSNGLAVGTVTVPAWTPTSTTSELTMQIIEYPV